MVAGWGKGGDEDNIGLVGAVKDCNFDIRLDSISENVIKLRVRFYSKPKMRFSGRFYNSRFSPPSS